jgi:hypothetical protein
LAGTVTDGCVQQAAYDVFVLQLRVVFIHDAVAPAPTQHMSAMLSLANWLYESRLTSAKGFDLWSKGAPFVGWIWSPGYESPHSLESLKGNYEHLISPATHSRRMLRPRVVDSVNRALTSCVGNKNPQRRPCGMRRVMRVPPAMGIGTLSNGLIFSAWAAATASPIDARLRRLCSRSLLKGV